MRKKRKSIFFIICILSFCAACAKNGIVKDPAKNACNGLEEPSNAIALDGGALDGIGKEPLWAQGIQTEAELFSEMNLDGIGDSDDEAYVSIYQFGDFEDKVTILRIHLGTGETLAQVFPVYGHYTLQTGNLFSEDKEAIVLEIQDPTSNYGAATIFVADIFAGGIDPDIPCASAALRLNTWQNTYTDPFAKPSTLDSNGRSLDFDRIVFGTEIVNVQEMPLQGLKVCHLGPNDKFPGQSDILYWTGNECRADDGWSILTE